MSNILSALEQSEQSYQQQSFGQHSLSPTKHEHRTKTLEWLLLIAVVVIPVTGVSGYYWHQNNQSILRDAKSISLLPMNTSEVSPSLNHIVENPALPDAQEVIFEKELADSSLKVLSYPEFVTAPLPTIISPVITKSVSVDPVASAPKIMTEGIRQVPSKTIGQNELQLDQFDLSQLSPDIAARLQNALGVQEQDFLDTENEMKASSDVISLSQASSLIKDKLPALDFQAHIYASDPSRRWTKVNNVEVVEGDEIAAGVRLEQIQPRYVVISFLGQQLSIPALYEWQP